MKITGQVALDFPQQAVWDAFMDPDFVAQVIPGCDSLTPAAEPDAYVAHLVMKIGPVKGRFKADLTQTDKRPLHHFRLAIQAQGPVGFITGAGDVDLEAEGPQRTRMRYAGSVDVGGRIAGVGQRLIEATAKALINRGLKAFVAKLEAVLQAQAAS